MSSRWTEKTTVKFVQEYRDKPCLWNTKLSLYKNKQAREAALKNIQDNMGIEGFGPNEIKNKIKALRSTYSQEKKKIKDSKKSGAGTESIYVPNVKWFIEMDSFLNNLEDNKRPTEDNLNTVHSEQVHGENDTQVEEVPLVSVGTATKKNKTDIFQTERGFHNGTGIKKISETAIKEPEKENEYIIFGRSVAAQLMGLKDISAIRAQEQIQSVLTSFKVQDLQQNDNFNYSTALERVQHTPYTSRYTATPMQSPGGYTSSSLQSPAYTNSDYVQSEHSESRIDLNSSGVHQDDILGEALGDTLSNF